MFCYFLYDSRRYFEKLTIRDTVYLAIAIMFVSVDLFFCSSSPRSQGTHSIFVVAVHSVAPSTSLCCLRRARRRCCNFYAPPKYTATRLKPMIAALCLESTAVYFDLMIATFRF